MSKTTNKNQGKAAGKRSAVRGHSATREHAGARGRSDARSSAKTGQNSSARANAEALSSLCAVSAQCGACQTLDVPYAEQLSAKQAFIVDLFDGIAPAEAFRKILGMDEPFHYRNKVVSPYAPGRKMPARTRDAKAKEGRGKPGRPAARREVLTGMYAKGTHRLIPADTCLLENEVAKKATLVVRDLMRKWDIEPYDEDAGTGFLRHAVVRVGHESGEVLVTLVTNSEDFPSSKSFCRELVKRVPAITTVVQNVNLRQTNVILGDRERTLYGPGFILDTLCGLSFRISSRSFYQVNAVQTEALYNAAVDLAKLRGEETVIDAYCGTGTIGLVAASRGARRVVGVDTVESAIRDARENARHNGIENAEFVAADAGAFMRDMARDRVAAPCHPEERAAFAPHVISSGEGEAATPAREDLVLLMDPPRAGASEEFLRAAEQLAPARIVYISCNPETQARDVAHLVRAGYAVEAVQPVDMFPHTQHVECICSLELRS